MVVGVLLAIDLAIMTTWQVSDPFYRATKQMDPYVSSDFIVFRLLYIILTDLQIHIFFLIL